VDWEAVSRNAQTYTDEDLNNFREQATRDAARVAYRLEQMIDEAAQKKEQFLEWMGDVQTKNMRNINQAVDDYQSAVDVSKFVRDTSADGLMVGASVMSGGAAVAVMGAGSFLKGEAKFQDTGSVGAGVMEGAGSFVFAYVKLGKSFSFKQDMVLALIQAPYKSATELVGGASLGKAALSGALKFTGPVIDQTFKLGPAKTIFDKLAIPIVITYPNKGGIAQNVASTVLSKWTAKTVTKQGVENKGKNWILGQSSTSASSEDNSANVAWRRRGALIDQTTLTNKYLLYLAYVNMNNGIGRGW
jgi:hypothetical protein